MLVTRHIARHRSIRAVRAILEDSRVDRLAPNADTGKHQKHFRVQHQQLFCILLGENDVGRQTTVNCNLPGRVLKS
jgi:hypothetical protein